MNLPEGVTLQWESLAPIAREIWPLFQRHWEEIGLRKDIVPLDPNWDLYFQYNLLGRLYVLTVRSDGILSGYVLVLVGPHPHFSSTMWAQVDMFWLDPALRKGTLGIQMFRETEKRMKGLGAKVMVLSMKLHFLKERGTLGKLFERLGYGATDTVYAKTLE